MRARRARRPLPAGTPAPSAPRGCPPRFGRRSRTRIGRWSRMPVREPLAAAPVGFQQALSLHRRRGRLSASATALPAAVGAALANRKHGRLTVNIQNDGDPDVRARRAVDRGAQPHSAAEHDAQQPRLSSGADADSDHGRPAISAASRAPASATCSPILRLITPSWRRAWACTAKARSPIQAISRLQSSAPSKWSKAEVRLWWMW